MLFGIEEVLEGLKNNDTKRVVSVNISGNPIYKKGDKILGSALNSFRGFEGKVKGYWIKSDEFDEKETYEVLSHSALQVSNDYREIEKDFNSDGTPRMT